MVDVGLISLVRDLHIYQDLVNLRVHRVILEYIPSISRIDEGLSTWYLKVYHLLLQDCRLHILQVQLIVYQELCF